MAAVINLSIDQGSDFSLNITAFGDDGEYLDLTDANLYSQFRRHPRSTVGYNFTATVITPEEGLFNLYISGAYTSNIRPGRFLYDVEALYGDGTRVRVAEGLLTLTPEITKI